MKNSHYLWGMIALLITACAVADKGKPALNAASPGTDSGCSSLPKTYEECLKCGGYTVQGEDGEMCRIDYTHSKEPKLCELCIREGFGQFVIEGGIGPDGFMTGGDGGCSFRIYKKGNRLAKSNWAD